MRMLVLQSMRPVLWGLGVGLAGALASARLLESLLFNVTPIDATVYAGVAALLAFAALAAAFGPTLRAMRIDPVHTLRSE